jgi:hypothetical protein
MSWSILFAEYFNAKYVGIIQITVGQIREYIIHNNIYFQFSRPSAVCDLFQSIHCDWTI